MQWIDEKALATWAERTDARALLADMVSDLIRATISDASRFRFPGGDVGQLRGWDGDLETADAVSIVPAGKSKWEFGAGAGAKKASSDYEKRTASTDLKVMAENVLVLVNLECWDTPREKITEWEKERKAENKWRDVLYVDAVILVHWLDQHPAVAARYARDVLHNAPKEGALSTDEFWHEYSLQFNPRLTETLVIGDRQQIAAELIAKLSGPAQSILLGAETSEEVVAFAVAAIRMADAAKRRSLEVRTLIVQTESAARFLSKHSELVFITIKGAESLAGVLAEKGATLSCATGVQARRHQTLQRQTASSMADGFVSMGLERDAGYELAQRCGRSLTILKRLIPRGVAPKPEWVQHAALLKPAFLAGGWSSNRSLDRELLKELGGLSKYEVLESALLPTLSMSDRPIDRVDDVWQVRAPVDAFYFYGEQVSDVDLQRLREAILKVFGHAIEDPSREQIFSLSYVAPADYSKWLRDGLALTLLIIAAMHGVSGLQVTGKTPQQYVDEIVTALPEWGRRHQTLVGLGDQTALFAEAAPNPFMTALESMLEGARGDNQEIFQSDSIAIFSRSSPHVEILWALENIAWDPKYLNRAALILGKLAELDPDPESNHVNRPINSLRSILLSWAPNTFALVAQRIACVDQVLSKCPAIGWQLVTKLLPRPHDSSSPTQKPKLREVAPKNQEVLSFGIVWDFQAEMVKRAITLADDKVVRVIALIEAISAFRPACRTAVLTHVDTYLTTHQSAEGSEVWHALKAEVARHEFFSDTDWALLEDERIEIFAIVNRHRPSDPLAIERYAFDDWTPHVGKYAHDELVNEDPDVLRKDILERVLAREGPQGIVRLARIAKLPNLIGPALRLTSITKEQLLDLLEAALNPTAPGELAFYVSAVGAERYGEAWRAAFKKRSLRNFQNDSETARLLLGWPLNEQTWTFVRDLGEGVNEEYWRHTHALPIHGTLDQLLFAVEELRRRDRSLEVIGLLHLRLKELPTSLIMSLLTEGQGQIANELRRTGNMLPYHVDRAFKELRARIDASEIDIAREEYAYLPVLSEGYKPLTILSLLSKDPELFVNELSHAYRAKHAPRDVEPTAEAQARARVSYRLLSSFKTIPGLHQNKISQAVLSTWVIGVQEAAKRKDLVQISDQYIGHVLAHAPIDTDESFWPPSPVCEVIEAVASDHIESGIRIECFNKRGVFGKAINEGGGQERDLAATYKAWAESTVHFPRTSAMLASIAESWRQQGEQEDIRAEKDKMKM